MVFKANKNPNGDLLVFAGETICVPIPKESLDKGLSFVKKLLVPAIETTVCPRLEKACGPLSDSQEAQLRKVVKDVLDEKD